MRGDGQTSPFVWAASDYQGLQIKITVDYDNATGALIDAIVHRDDGCQYHTIVFDVPTSAKAKKLAAPADGAGDATYTAAQMSKQGLNTITDVNALQITAQP